MNEGRTRTFDGGPRDGVSEPLAGVKAIEYLTPDGAAIREREIKWTTPDDPAKKIPTYYADVYGRECGSSRRARVVRYIWCGQQVSSR